VRARDFYRTTAPVAFASLGALASVLALRRAAHFERPLVGLAVSFVLSVAVVLLLLLATRRGRAALADVRQTFRMLTRRRDAE
jgi:hypothetical protein